MSAIDRRSFVKTAAAAAATMSLRPNSLLANLAAAIGEGPNVLVFIFLRGGADGLALVPPHGDAAYYTARPTIALPPPKKEGAKSIVDLDGYFGLHPALAALKPLYDERRFAIVQAVGCTALTRSHFDAQEFMETGTPGTKGTPKGFLTRSIDGIQGPPLTKAISFARLRPRALQGPGQVLVTRDLRRFNFDPHALHGEAEALIRSMYAQQTGTVGQVGRDALDILELIRTTPALSAPVGHGAAYPEAFVGTALRQAAQVVRANIGTRCIFVDLDGTFDTHSDQLWNNQAEFEPIARAIAAFYTDLGAESDRVTTMVASEFGRALEENGAKGTDHGSAGAMFVIGNRVRGGKVFGQWPGLQKSALYEERDIAVTTDFRDVFAEVVHHHLRAPSVATLFPKYALRGELGLFG
jgi:uncharacterized protein (DUF1501 family)